MRLTHYEDGSLGGNRFCINLIRHCGDTFPDLGEGQGLNRFLTYIHIVFLIPFPAFSFDATGPKEKANKKKMPIREFRSCGSDQGSAFGIRKLLKKFDQNF